jgi:hypothetical protein
MSILGGINEALFGGNEQKALSTVTGQQQGVLNEMMNNAGTYRDLASQSKSMYNPQWEQMQRQQVFNPMRQRMADNMRELKQTNRKSGRATSAIGRRLNESANLRMSQMNMQQGIIENQRRIAMEQEARERALGYEQMANSQLQNVLGRRAQENVIQHKAGTLTPVIQLAAGAAATKNLGKNLNFGGGGNFEEANVNEYNNLQGKDLSSANIAKTFGG